jgi:hypothetical protein
VEILVCLLTLDVFAENERAKPLYESRGSRSDTMHHTNPVD